MGWKRDRAPAGDRGAEERGEIEEAPRGLAALTLGLAIAVATLALYARTVSFGYVFDDRFFIVGNPGLAKGLTREGLHWAFTAFYHANWHPVAWLAHMADRAVFGPGAGTAHLVNGCLHALCSVLLFLMLRRLTGALLASSFVAAAFALHPLRVESVAWVTERKDVLSAIFWILAMDAYVHYARRPRIGRYVLVASVFAVGLLTKPMVVTLPLVLLLLDWWPLGRFAPRRAGGVPARRLLLEKVPLLLLAGGAAAATVLSQRAYGAVQELEMLSATIRSANALVTYVRYLCATFWPANLAVYYPHPGSGLPGWQVAVSLLLLAALTVLALLRARRNPGVAFGWLWYLATLVPVIGLIQVGEQSRADRFTYLPSIGLLIALSWGIKQAAGRLCVKPVLLALAALVALGSLAAVSWRQIGFWRDDVTLFSRALAVTSDNWIAENNLGFALAERGDVDQAVDHYREALRIRPDYEAARFNLGSALERLGRVDEARVEYQAAVHIKPDYAEAHYRLGVILADQGQRAAAIAHYRLALRVLPGNASLRMNLANVLSDQGVFDEALSQYEQALRHSPNDARIFANRGVTHAQMGRLSAAAADYRQALRLDPENATARRGLQRLPAAVDVK